MATPPTKTRDVVDVDSKVLKLLTHSVRLSVEDAQHLATVNQHAVTKIANIYDRAMAERAFAASLQNLNNHMLQRKLLSAQLTLESTLDTEALLRGEVEILTQELQRTTSAIQACHSKVLHLEEQNLQESRTVEELQQQLQTVTQQCKETQTSLQAAQQLHSSLQADQAAARQQQHVLQSSLDAAQQEHHAALQAHEQEFNQLSAQYRASQEAMHEQLATLQQELAVLKSNAKQLQDERHLLQQQLQQLRTAHDQSQELLQKKGQEGVVYADELVALRQQMAHERIKRSNAEGQLLDYKHQLAHAQAANAQQTQQVTQLQEQVAELQRQCRELQEERSAQVAQALDTVGTLLSQLPSGGQEDSQGGKDGAAGGASSADRNARSQNDTAGGAQGTVWQRTAAVRQRQEQARLVQPEAEGRREEQPAPSGALQDAAVVGAAHVLPLGRAAAGQQCREQTLGRMGSDEAPDHMQPGVITQTGREANGVASRAMMQGRTAARRPQAQNGKEQNSRKRKKKDDAEPADDSCDAARQAVVDEGRCGNEQLSKSKRQKKGTQPVGAVTPFDNAAPVRAVAASSSSGEQQAVSHEAVDGNVRPEAGGQPPLPSMAGAGGRPRRSTRRDVPACMATDTPKGTRAAPKGAKVAATTVSPGRAAGATMQHADDAADHGAQIQGAAAKMPTRPASTVSEEPRNPLTAITTRVVNAAAAHAAKAPSKPSSVIGKRLEASQKASDHRMANPSHGQIKVPPALLFGSQFSLPQLASRANSSNLMQR